MALLKALVKIVLGLLGLAVLAVAGLALSLRATIPEDHFDLRAPGPGTDYARPVLIFGATRNTGYEVAKLLRARGQPVTAAVRASSDRSLLEPLGVGFVVADALEPGAVRAALAGAEYSAVISTIGCMRCDPPPDFLGNRNIVDAARVAGVDRMILISTIGAGDSYDAANLLSRFALRDLLPLKTQAEDYLRDSGLEFTIIRPGGLRANDSAPTGAGILTENRTTLGFIHRVDLAELIVAAMDDERSIGKTFAAADTTVLRPWQ
ncbi:MAG: SDR family oxidoreductase [Gammaproteobacteria bacterium]|nr:SDR family oxidoreductase [Gammaproteobacteria bacterium]